MTDTTRRRLLLAAPPLVLVLALSVWVWTQSISATVLDLPGALTDREFWALVEDYSEAGGFFRSDNLVSNEDTFQHVIPELTRIVRPGGVYLGVGPDQNFTYLAALRPKLAFIVDIRRGNLHAHLMYKALFELSEDRATFLSKLFSRPAPDGVGRDVPPGELFDAFVNARPDRQAYEDNLQAIYRQLTEVHGFRLARGDREGIEYVYSSFFAAGPFLAYSNAGGGMFARRNPRYPSFQALQVATDGEGHHRAYLASDEAYQAVRAMQRANLIVPLVGNFAGPKALRAVGAYLRDRGATVTAFYTSNVEQYLFQDRIWGEFARNVMALPLGESSTFIRSCFNTCDSPVGSRSVTKLDSMPGLMADFAAGRITSYWDVTMHTR
ncbi:MAG: hypothetical protein R2752_07650 [Vicinamibacterales bacterium]